jgi:hypothetical protein
MMPSNFFFIDMFLGFGLFQQDGNYTLFFLKQGSTPRFAKSISTRHHLEFLTRA